MELSINQTLLDDGITIYSGHLDESDEKFNISIQNKWDSFDETFYIHEKSIIKKYTGYTSQQKNNFSPTITSAQTTIVSEDSVIITPRIVEKLILVENQKQVVAEKSVIDQTQSIRYTPEPVSEELVEVTCGIGTKSLNGICKIIISDETKFYFLFRCC